MRVMLATDGSPAAAVAAAFVADRTWPADTTIDVVAVLDLVALLPAPFSPSPANVQPLEDSLESELHTVVEGTAEELRKRGLEVDHDHAHGQARRLPGAPRGRHQGRPGGLRQPRAGRAGGAGARIGLGRPRRPGTLPRARGAAQEHGPGAARPRRHGPRHRRGGPGGDLADVRGATGRGAVGRTPAVSLAQCPRPPHAPLPTGNVRTPASARPANGRPMSRAGWSRA